MRVRLPIGRTAFFLGALAFALVALLPLRVAAGWFALGGRGLAAREASGSLWSGALNEAQFGAVPLGDLHARLNFWPLFLGRARMSLSRGGPDGAFEGAAIVTRHTAGVEDLGGQVRLGALFAPLPLATLDLADVSARFAGGQCESAEGTVRAGLSGDVAGFMAATALGGPVRCAEGDLQLALAGQTGMEQLDLRIAGDGRWRIDLLVRPSEPAAAARLAAAGFTASGGAYVRRIEGSF